MYDSETIARISNYLFDRGICTYAELAFSTANYIVEMLEERTAFTYGDFIYENQ